MNFKIVCKIRKIINRTGAYKQKERYARHIVAISLESRHGFIVGNDMGRRGCARCGASADSSRREKEREGQ